MQRVIVCYYTIITYYYVIITQDSTVRLLLPIITFFSLQDLQMIQGEHTYHDVHPCTSLSLYLAIFSLTALNCI